MNNIKHNAIYEIESRCDFLTGMYLIVRIPDNDLDENALYTIQADCPDFILPFNYKSINGEIELTYKIGSLCKLQYFYGDLPYDEYIAIWNSMISPLLECGDWFMNPCSFVLSAEHLYYDKHRQVLSYVYIPSINRYSEQSSFNEMAADVSKNITISDAVLENKVLKSIISGFNPKDFLKMLVEHIDKPVDIAAANQIAYSDISYQAQVAETAKTQAQWAEPKMQIQGVETKAETGGFKFFFGKNRKKSKRKNGFRNTMPVILPIQSEIKQDSVFVDTQEVKTEMSGAGLRCVGRAHFPDVIEVRINDGDIFTIGRFDANVGKKQSNFEFDMKTKAVSRRHAAIERTGSMYRIVDLSSSAGTFVNDDKLPPNTPFELLPGSRISFGNLGADYVWELSL